MYKIQLLDTKDFDNLPKSITRGSDIKDSMGFADPRTKKAYVRNTHMHELNKFLINHELEELMTHESYHEDENGIRHKKAGGILGTIGIILAATVAGALTGGLAFPAMTAPILGMGGSVIGGGTAVGLGTGGAIGGGLLGGGLGAAGSSAIAKSKAAKVAKANVASDINIAKRQGQSMQDQASFMGKIASPMSRFTAPQTGAPSGGAGGAVPSAGGNVASKLSSGLNTSGLNVGMNKALSPLQQFQFGAPAGRPTISF